MLNLRPDSNEPTTLTINGQQVVNPAYVPNRGKAHAVVYAKNHNVLRVVNGFAGLLFKI